MEPATRRPGHCPEPGSRFCLHRQREAPPKARWIKPTTSTGKQAASSGRKLSYAKVGAAYAEVLAGRPVKGATGGVDSSAPLSTKRGDSHEGKGGSVPRNSPHDQDPLRGEGRHGVHYCWLTLGRSTRRSKQAKWEEKEQIQWYLHCAGTRCFVAAASRRTSPGAPSHVSERLSVVPNGITSSKAQVDKVFPMGIDATKPRCRCLGWETLADSCTGFARSPKASSWPRWK
jgi:hypothetical protein